MRAEVQPWNDIRVTVEIVDEGTGVTGLTVTCHIKRTSDGQWLQDGGGWGASIDTLDMSEVDSTNLPGLYGFTIGSDDQDAENGHYIVLIRETTYALREHLRIVQAISAEDQRILFSLRHCMRFIPTAWDATTKQPTSGSLFLYENDTFYDADTVPDGTGAYKEIVMEASFTSGQLDVYGVKTG